MQLPPDDELVLVSGMAPIRARKLRYFEDRAFKARLCAPPALGRDGYADRPAPRADDWRGRVSAADARLAAQDEHDLGEDDGGLEQQRHPAIEAPAAPSEPVLDTDSLDPDRDDGDLPADQRAMDRVRAALIRGHAINQGQAQDLLPGL